MQITGAMIKELREQSGAGMSACKNALTEAAGDMTRAIEILREKGLAAAQKKAGRIAAEGLVAACISQDRKTGALVEVNSETDFVSRNEEFVAFVNQVARHAQSRPRMTENALLEEPFITGKDTTLRAAITNIIATFGENIGLRRYAKYEAGDNALIIDYIHGGGRVGVMLEISCECLSDECIDAGRNVCMQIAAMNPQYLSRDDVPADVTERERTIITQLTENEEAEAAEKAKEKGQAYKSKPPQILEKMIEGRVSKSLNEICLMQQEYVKDDKMTVSAYLHSVCKDLTVTRFVRYERGEGIEKKEENFADEVKAALG